MVNFYFFFYFLQEMVWKSCNKHDSCICVSKQQQQRQTNRLWKRLRALSKPITGNCEPTVCGSVSGLTVEKKQCCWIYINKEGLHYKSGVLSLQSCQTPRIALQRDNGWCLPQHCGLKIEAGVNDSSEEFSKMASARWKKRGIWTVPPRHGASVSKVCSHFWQTPRVCASWQELEEPSLFMHT